MINIASFKVLKGYEHWKTVFMDEAFVKRREEAGLKFWLKDLMRRMKGFMSNRSWIQWKSSKCHGKKPGKN